MELFEKTYSPSKLEDYWYNYWQDNKAFTPYGSDDSPTFCIVIPPPNVTGSLHMGHALNATIQDILCRYKRMSGFKTLWVPGTDHAGIATQNVVEKSLAKDKIDRHKLGRDAFIQRVWSWKAEYGDRIIYQLKKLGASCDWEHLRFTMDEGLSKAVREVFVRLFEEGLIYRDNRLINWCPRCHTALSDLEAEHEEIEGRLYFIKYPLTDGSGHITVATTRPETMLGDTAVAVHPEDERYKDFIGKSVDLPLTSRKIPIIADNTVDKDFGTGAVKITPAHDFNDEASGKRHNLSSLSVINEEGKMTTEAGLRYKGLDRHECRKLILKDLKEKDLLESEKKHSHNVGHCYRCKTIIEPLQTIQWYVNVSPLAEKAIKAVEQKEISFIPEQWENNYFAWMRDIKDWCISRQIWWGHQIPVWYCPDCKNETGQLQGELIEHTFFSPVKVRGKEITHGNYTQCKDLGLSHDDIIKNSKIIRVPKSVKSLCSRFDITKCPHCNSNNLIRDPDVLDTWFSSALWPFSTLGWPEDTKDLRDFYPTSVLVTAFDIIFFWVARMIMMGLKFMGKPPFKDVYIHAIVRDSKGQKMSKSMGNIIDPLVMIEKYGADAFRFSLAVFAAHGRDIRFSEERVEGYRHFINKIWNAAKFISTYQEFHRSSKLEDIKGLQNKWILTRLNFTIEEVIKGIESYRFNDSASAIYQFVWHEFCDWYIELIKPELYSDNKLTKTEIVNCFYFIFEKILLLLHPFMPFVTEELWNKFLGKKTSIMLSSFPKSTIKFVNSEAEMANLFNAITGIRSIRGELNITPSLEIKAIINTPNNEVKRVLLSNMSSIKKIAKCSEIEIVSTYKRAKGTAVTVRDLMEIYIPLEGILDVNSEKSRLMKELEKIDKEMVLIKKKLSNEDFLKNAPQQIVEKEKAKFDTLSTKKEKTAENLKLLKTI
ncbi:MAG TPA: valine--tRNA ligase [Nitrospirae bacterium]|nr:valine--tRNA ligase [Nitrospirota bacterium]